MLSLWAPGRCTDCQVSCEPLGGVPAVAFLAESVEASREVCRAAVGGGAQIFLNGR